jgi:hypothetical protein
MLSSLRLKAFESYLLFRPWFIKDALFLMVVFKDSLVLMANRGMGAEFEAAILQIVSL